MPLPRIRTLTQCIAKSFDNSQNPSGVAIDHQEREFVATEPGGQVLAADVVTDA